MSHAVIVREEEPHVGLVHRQPLGLLRPIAPAAEVLVAQEATRSLVQDALKEGRDYGKIPGVDKPSLLKPGAERVALAFGCSMRFRIVEAEVDHNRDVTWTKRKKVWRNEYQGDRRFDWQEEHGASLGVYRYVVECEIVHRESGQVVGSCLGSCSSMESKYIDRPRDCENTIIKMAEKRALVGATLTTFGLSEQFTQDVEDLPREQADAGGDREPPVSSTATAAPSGEPEPACPKCGDKMWDNRARKTNPKAPDFKCRARSCDGVFWPGQWPPKPAATDAQRERISQLMEQADITDKQKDKIRRELADTEKPMNVVRATEVIDRLEKLQEAAANNPQTDMLKGGEPAGAGVATGAPADDRPWNTQGADNAEF